MKKLKTIFLVIILLLSLVLVPSCGDSSSITFDIDNSYFTVDGYNRSESISSGVFSNSSTTKYYIKIKATCTAALSAYSMTAQFYSSDSTLLETYESGTVKQAVEANTQFTVSAQVSAETYSSVKSVTAVLSGKSADGTSGGGILSGTWYTVTLVYNNGNEDGSVSVKKGATLATPADPVKANYIFTGWYTTSSLTTKYDFSQSVTKDFTIYAGYEIDATTLTNTITTSSIKGLVTVYNKCYNTFLGITTSYETHQV